MKIKRIAILLVGTLIVFSMFPQFTLAETKKLKQIGRYTLIRIKGEVPTSEVMETLVKQYAGDIKYGFDLAGYGDLFLPFLDQLKEASFEEKELPVGDKLMWMLFRSQGKIKIVKDLEWAGKSPLPVFSFTVKRNYKHYEFVMPKPCGNIALRKVEEIIPEAICDIKVTPAKANLNDPISVDMSGSQHVQSMEVEVFNQEGEKVSSQSLSPDSPVWQTKFEEPGKYVFKGKAVNPEGKPSTNPCEAETYINYPPVSELSCFPCQEYVGKAIKLDASDSRDQDGEVVKVSFEIIDDTNTTIDRYTDTEKPFEWNKVFEEEGTYTVIAVATDDFGGVSEPSKVEVRAKHKRLFILADAGPLFSKGSLGTYLGARLGFAYSLVPRSVDFVISGGGAFTLSGDPWKSIFVGNALVNIHTGAAFFGVGAGFTTEVKEERGSDIDLIANFGFDVFNDYTSAASIFFEARGPVGEDRSFSDNYKFMFGFRYLF